MQEWVSTVGVVAGLNSDNTRLCTGALGCPESRLEVSCQHDLIAALTAEWHDAWTLTCVLDHTLHVCTQLEVELDR